MWWPSRIRGTLRVSRGDAGGEQVLTFRRGDDAEILYNVAVGAVFAVRHLRRTWTQWFTVLAIGVLWWQIGWLITGLLVAAVTAGMIVWRFRWPDSFERHVAADVRGRWRHTRVYRKPWQSTMENRGLAMLYGDVEHLPAVRRVVANRFTDQLLIEPLNGQPIEEFEKSTSGLARTFKAQRCRVREDTKKTGRIWLDFTKRDALEQTIPAVSVPDEPDLKALPLGKTEFGDPWTLKLLGAHVFIAGRTGAGKGSVVWSIIRAMGPLIANGTVRLWVIDPKGGMELRIGLPLFYRFAIDLDSAQDLLVEAVGVMQARATRLGEADKRLHEPTPQDPFDVVFIDELANLTAYDKSNPQRQKRTLELAQLALSQGRAPGLAVVAAAQDPRADVIVFRQLFPTAVALGLKTEDEVKMVLGAGARAMGAECDKIGPSQSGTGYVQLEGVREPQRVRAGWVTDDVIKQMRQQYVPGSAPGMPADQLAEPLSPVTS